MVDTKFKKGVSPWNKGKKMSEEARERMRKARLGKKHTEEVKKKISEGIKKHLPSTAFKKGEVAWNKGKKGEVAWNKGYKGYFSGEENTNWKGEEVGYSALHSWVRRKKGKAIKCEYCHKTEGKIEWANKDHEYNRDLEDFIQLCTSCHRKYDYKFNN